MAEVKEKVFQLQDVLGQRQVEETADVIIIGTGAAGATAARVLSAAGLDVIMLEEGPRITVDQLRSDVYTSFRRMWRDYGFQLAQGRTMLSVLQGRCVGGSTAINSAIIHRLPEDIHANWRNDYGLEGILSYARLNDAWDILERELHVSVTSEDILGENNRLMREAVTRIGMTGNVIQRNVQGCEGTAHCQTGCPNSRRQAMDVSYVPRSLQSGARLYATCKALQVIGEGGRATGVKAQFFDPETRQAGPPAFFKARQAVFVAASAIQTPLILHASGIGRQSGLVGKRFQAHPGIALPGYFEKPVKIWFGATQGYESLHLRSERMKFESLGLPTELGAIRLPGFGAELMHSLADYQHIAQWAVQIRARAHGTVKKGLFGQTVVKYDLTNEDVRTWKKGLKLLAQMMFEMDAKEVYPSVYGLPERVTSFDQMKKLDDLPDDPSLFHSIVSHLFGTAVMGKNPSQSVVGLDCQAHELPGLYVIDSSIFPTNIGVNPQHTICAVAWLAAEHLAEKLKG